jgi:hypothetical protein
LFCCEGVTLSWRKRVPDDALDHGERQPSRGPIKVVSFTDFATQGVSCILVLLLDETMGVT